MTEALVIRLKPTSSAVASDVPQSIDAEWIAVDGSGARHGNVQSGPLANAAGFAGGRKVIVIVPGTDVYLAEPVLPVKSGAKLLQVVPFALEEQMATDIDDLHFAVGRRDDRPGTPVAAVAREQMQSWVEALRSASLHVDAIYPETAALPVTPNGVTLLVDDARVFVQREATPGAVLDVQPLIEAVQLGLASGDDSREHVTIYLTESVYEHERDLFEGLREFTASLQLKLLPDGPLPLLAANVMTKPSINLLQGAFAPKTRLRMSFAPWRYAAALLVAFLALHVGLNAWQFFDLQRKEQRLDAEIAQVFQQAMPGAPVPDAIGARKQVEMRLNALRGSGPTSGVLTTLGMLVDAMAQAPGASLEALSYRDRATDLRILAPSVDQLDKIQHVAVERGFSAEIQSASPRDSKIEGRLKLKQSGA
ncbi:MAG TPA: type II secretion system protein GspL [Povalibacter sp.]|uniref:type II secretion system protein GspL n=1 Tax=Povalibacter sp. TaxID=1962978 RepID=UPI002BA0D9EB|nr:type II secretion system protein GspL [Povalibacter sp.]HMN43293.1 type II secretion system protein GspL [Povalibacter sp.]